VIARNETAKVAPQALQLVLAPCERKLSEAVAWGSDVLHRQANSGSKFETIA
jgi:hypothetical protein